MNRVIRSNKVNAKADWSFKDPEEKPKKFVKHIAKQNNKKKKKQTRFTGDFYKSEEWRKLRYRVIQKYGAKCMLCGRSHSEHGVVIHVDHIKPRSKHPELDLNFDNLQVLCEDCNIGKSNNDENDYRQEFDESELSIVASANRFI